MCTQGGFGFEFSDSEHVYSRTVLASGKSDNNNNEKVSIKTIKDLTQIIADKKN